MFVLTKQMMAKANGKAELVLRRVIITKKQVTTNRSNAVSGDRWVIETDGLLLKNVTGYVVRHDLFFVKTSQCQCNQ